MNTEDVDKAFDRVGNAIVSLPEDQMLPFLIRARQAVVIVGTETISGPIGIN